MVLIVEKYLIKTGIKKDEVFSLKETENIMNKNVVSLYRGRITLTEKKEFTGYEIAEKLHIIHSKFEFRGEKNK